MRHSALLQALALAGTLLASGGWTSVLAQDSDDQKRGVARISLMDGDVSVHRGDSGDWVAAAPNAPLTAQDRVATGPASRVEIQLDSGNILRLGSNAEVNLAELEYRRFILQMSRGTGTFRVLRETGADTEIDTPNVSVRPSKQGAYRITVRENGETEVTARSGQVEVFTPRGTQWVNAGQTMLARGTASDPEFQMAQALAYDDWDRWSDSRDQAFERSVSVRNVSPDVYGAEDLDPYGQWVSSPQYGNVWRPTVAAGWAPYRNGRWVWLDWYGWTWVSSDPWGWAPYHYGSWYYDAGWCWYPGGRGRHYWSPARVAFFGYGVGVGVGFGAGWGHVGWVPIGPGEHFSPWWGRNYYGGYHNHGYVDRSVNITNNVNITNVYRNARIGNGVTAVNAGDFSHGRFNNVSQVTGNDLRQASLVRGQIPAAPGDAHLKYSDRAASNVPAARTENTRFFSRRQPEQIQRVSFADQRQSLAQGSRIPVAERSVVSGVTANPMSGSPQVRGDAGGRGVRGPASAGAVATPQSQAPVTRTPNADNGSRGWRRFGDPSGVTSGQAAPAGNQSVSPAAPVQRNSDSSSRGWRRFGDPSGAASSQPAPAGNARGNVSPAAPAQRNSDNGSRGWNRFGYPSGGGSSQPAPAGNQSVSPAVPSQRNRFGYPSGNPGDSQQRNVTPSAPTPRAPAPRSESPAPRNEGRNNYQAPRSAERTYPAPSVQRQESIRVSPPVVRERSSGGGNSAPRAERSGGNASRSESSGGQGSRSGGSGHGGRGR